MVSYELFISLLERVWFVIFPQVDAKASIDKSTVGVY